MNEIELREQIQKLTKINRIFTLIILIGFIFIIIAVGTLVYSTVSQMGVFTNFLFEVIEGAPHFRVLTAIGGLVATIGFIPSFYFSFKKAELLGELKQPMQSSLRLTHSLKIVYALTLGSTLPLFLLYVTDYISAGTSSYSVLTVTMWNLPNFFLYNIPALAIFGLVFLTKGNGFNYFISWKVGRKVQLSILSIVIGYTSIAFQDFYFPASASFSIRPSFGPSPSYYYLIYLGLSLIVLGFVSLILLARGNRNNQAMSLN